MRENSRQGQTLSSREQSSVPIAAGGGGGCFEVCGLVDWTMR